jgi:glycerol-3-phosphate acyltransferase PlsY
MDLLSIATLIFATLLGSVPFGFLLSKYYLGIDLQGVGSGNIGATNAARAGGAKFGAVILGFDALKGACGPLAAQALGQSDTVIACAGLAAVVGHCYTPFLKMRGGKGVATSLGVIIAFEPWLGAVGVAVYGLVLALTRVSALGSLAGTGTCVALAWILRAFDDAQAMRIVLGVICVLIVWRHRSNLAALRQTQTEESA